MARDEAIIKQFRGNESAVIFNYLGQVDQSAGSDNLFSIADEEAGNIISPRRQREHQLSIIGSVLNGQLTFTVAYNGKQYSSSDVMAFIDGVKSGLVNIIGHCSSSDGCYTPSDFPMANVEVSALQSLQLDYPNLQDLYQSTPMQQGLLFHSLMDKSAYVTQLYLNVSGTLDVEAFKQAWHQVVQHYDVFRTVFVGEEMHQLVLADGLLDFTVEDLRGLDTDTQIERFEKYRLADKQRSFDIQALPLLRLSLFKLDDETSRMLLSYHHAVMDAWSQAIVLKHVMQCYEANISGGKATLPALIPYRNYIQWLEEQDKPAAQQYWHQVLGDFESPNEIGINQLIVNNNEEGPGYKEVFLSEEKTAALQALAQSTHTTLNTVIQAAWGYLIHRYSGDDKVVFGETTAGRPATLLDVGQIAGLFINTLPVRLDFDRNIEVAEWLQLVHKQGVERESYSYLPLLEIQDLSGIEKNTSLFNTLFAFNHFPIEEAVEDDDSAHGLRFTDFGDDEQTNYQLSFSVAVSERLEFSIDYKKRIFLKQQ